MSTYKDIISGLENYTEQHQLINDFGSGNITNLDTNQITPLIVWLQPTPSRMIGNITKLRFDMYVLDLLEHDLSNLNDILSNTLSVGNDIIQDFWFDEDEVNGFTMGDIISMEPFQAQFDIFTGGWVFTVETEMVTTACKTPTI